MFKYGVISGPYFPVFGLYTRKYGPEITLYLDTFHAVIKFMLNQISKYLNSFFSKYQYGFRKIFTYHHCLTAMLIKWKSAIKNKKSFE